MNGDPHPKEHSEPNVRPSLSSHWRFVLILTAIVLAIVTIFSWHQARELDRKLADLRSTMQQQERQLQQSREISALVTAHATAALDLVPQPGMRTGAARVIYNLKIGEALYEGQIAPAPAGKSYQLWLLPMSGNPVSLCVFNPAPNQTDECMMKLPASASAKSFVVTLEPAGGSSQPTGPKILVGGIP